jgi:hypothetical protein
VLRGLPEPGTPVAAGLPTLVTDASYPSHVESRSIRGNPRA